MNQNRLIPPPPLSTPFMSKEKPADPKPGPIAQHQNHAERSDSAFRFPGVSLYDAPWPPRHPDGDSPRGDISKTTGTTEALPPLSNTHHSQAHPPNKRSPPDQARARRGALHNTSPNTPPTYESIYRRSLQVIHYGPFYSIGRAGNVSIGVNHGAMVNHDGDEFISDLPTRLKVSVKADHRYYASGDEKALNHSYCAPGTRLAIIEAIIRWATDNSLDRKLVYWLSGQAGAGKTTIAYTICHLFAALVSQGDRRAILGGSFFCSRQFPETRSASAIIRTIVYQLALRSKAFRTALKEHGRFETVDHGPRSQLKGLLIEPWKKSALVRRAENEPCYVIPIDAVDELEGMGGTEFLDTLFDVLEEEDLSGLKFFVTSSLDPALVERITSFSKKQVFRLEDVPLEESSVDIKLYLSWDLRKCASEYQIQRLVSDAAGLFIYAATVVEYVKGRNVEEQRSLLKQLLSISSPMRLPSRGVTATLDNLYLRILETSLVDPRDLEDAGIFENCLSILHTFVCTVERTSTAVVVGLLNASGGGGHHQLDIGMAEGVLHRLHAVLYSQDGQIMLFHKSFSDFLFNRSRSQRFFCDQEEHHSRLASGCFGVMAKQLRFNIANIPTSSRMDLDDKKLSTRVKNNVSRPLIYACSNWNAHLPLTSLEVREDLAEALNGFLQLRILFWMELMSLLGQSGCCQGMLRNARWRIHKSKGPTELAGMLADAAAFAAYHASSKAVLSTPHLYLSSLATFSQHSAIVQTWRRQFRGIPEFVSSQRAGSNALVTSIPTGQPVHALAVSPDGVHVAIGSLNGLARILDLSMGEEVRGLEGHTLTVSAVAYSLGGDHVVSGSSDGSVRVWSLSAGTDAGVCRGRRSVVRAVACSPDGAFHVSGSCDGLIRMWNSSTGAEVGILKGHTSWVNAVAYSPDGTLVVSGSRDSSVRVWDLSTGAEARVLEGHSSSVNAVAYSPDGLCVVSGSDDKSIRVWDLLAGEVVKVLEGHSNWVIAVAYSPDGTRLVSGSYDRSVRVWDMSIGKEAVILKGHTGMVRTVAYSSDGTHVISGSDDKTVRVWNLSTKEKEILRGHTSSVYAVAYHPDGTCAISGSDNKSVKLWDLSTGAETVIFNRHTSRVHAVAYLPNTPQLLSASDDKPVRLWDLQVSTGEQIRALKGHTNLVWVVACSPDGTCTVSGSERRSVRLWDLSTGDEARIFEGHTDSVWAVAHSPDGTRAVSASGDKSVRVWDLASGEEVMVLNGHTSCVYAVAYFPGGTHVVSGSADKSVRLWDLSTQEGRVLEGHTDSVWAVAYSPDGTRIVSGSSDHSVRVWDISRGEVVLVLKGHTNSIRAVAYAPDGTCVISGSHDSSVRLWDISPEHKPRYIHQKGLDGQHTGWLLSPTDSSAHLMFVPPAAKLPDDANVLVLPKSEVSHVNLSNADIGDRWAKCYTPMPVKQSNSSIC